MYEHFNVLFPGLCPSSRGLFLSLAGTTCEYRAWGYNLRESETLNLYIFLKQHSNGCGMLLGPNVFLWGGNEKAAYQ